jgi:glutamate-ammonia-ligase adenylyltransferase
MVDVEFTVQYLVLLHSAHHRALTRNIGNIALLALASDLGLIPAALAGSAADAYREYRRSQHQIRLQGAALARAAPAAQARRREAVGELWMHVFGTAWRTSSRFGQAADFG